MTERWVEGYADIEQAFRELSPLATVESFHCKLFDFQANHRMLAIGARHKERYWELLYLVFLGVLYYSGPTDCESAKFQLAPIEEIRAFARQLGLAGWNLPEWSLGYKLYKTFDQRNEILIFCSSAYVTDERPVFY